jgi:hypothetical protein
MKKEKAVHRFSIIHHYLSPVEAVTEDNITVHREDKVFIPEMERFVMCAPDDTQFVYMDASNKKGRWFAWCTCGSIAVITGANVYKDFGSPSTGVGVMPGEMLICHHFATFGKHSPGK